MRHHRLSHGGCCSSRAVATSVGTRISVDSAANLRRVNVTALIRAALVRAPLDVARADGMAREPEILQVLLPRGTWREAAEHVCVLAYVMARSPCETDIEFHDQAGVRRGHVGEHVHDEADQQRHRDDVEEPDLFQHGARQGERDPSGVRGVGPG